MSVGYNSKAKSRKLKQEHNRIKRKDFNFVYYIQFRPYYGNLAPTFRSRPRGQELLFLGKFSLRAMIELYSRPIHAARCVASCFNSPSLLFTRHRPKS